MGGLLLTLYVLGAVLMSALVSAVRKYKLMKISSTASGLLTVFWPLAALAIAILVLFR